MTAKQVIVYFENSTDALRFTLAASSAIAGEARIPKSVARGDVSHEIKHATRILAADVAVADLKETPFAEGPIKKRERG